jgi:hypothetical protein
LSQERQLGTENTNIEWAWLTPSPCPVRDSAKADQPVAVDWTSRHDLPDNPIGGGTHGNVADIQ